MAKRESLLVFVQVNVQTATACLDVKIARTGEHIGFVSWRPQWRQYGFTPAPGGSFTRRTLQAINRKLYILMRRWSAQRSTEPHRGAPIPKPVRYAQRGRPSLERML